MKYLKTDLTGNVQIITLSRPEALNALNIELLAELKSVVVESIGNPQVRGMVITGDGDKAFVAGADIKELSALSEREATELSKRGQALFKMIEDSPKPVIAAIHGFALGGGCELAMSCHMRIASEVSKFGQPEVNLGIIPGYGATQRLTQLVGRGKAIELMLTGDLINAAEAKAIGLVNQVAPSKDEVMNLALKTMEKIAKKGPIAVGLVIKTVNAGFDFEKTGYSSEAENFGKCTLTEDFREGTSAFIEKRQPQFKGN
jgi:enoyl-CoA hydratase